jgi:serine/threonine-protein phosphatase 2A regulatory subunit A
VQICLQWLSDPVYSIRQAALSNFKELTRIFGAEWAQKHILQSMLDMRTHANYLYRLVALFGVAELS